MSIWQYKKVLRSCPKYLDLLDKTSPNSVWPRCPLKQRNSSYIYTRVEQHCRGVKSASSRNLYECMKCKQWGQTSASCTCSFKGCWFIPLTHLKTPRMTLLAISPAICYVFRSWAFTRKDLITFLFFSFSCHKIRLD